MSPRFVHLINRLSGSTMLIELAASYFEVLLLLAATFLILSSISGRRRRKGRVSALPGLKERYDYEVGKLSSLYVFQGSQGQIRECS
jgi:hypothetical protein